jgi:hypothetical protein
MVQNICIGDGHTRKTKKVAFIFLLLFLLATVVIAFHHHDDNTPHHDCPVCAAGYHFSSASVYSFPLEIHRVVSNYDTPKESILYNSVRLILLTSRSPPA